MRLKLRNPPPGRDRGSALVLVPAGFLVLLLLAALAVDSAAVYLGQRQLNDAVSAAANDAATAALADSSYYAAGRLQIDPQRAAQTVCAAVAAQADGDLHDIQLTMAVSPVEIEVRATATVNAVFGRNVPGYGHRRISAEAFAVPTQDSRIHTTLLGEPAPLAC